jgi:hypothetical protein
MSNNEHATKLKNINTIMFDRMGNMIKGDFEITEIIDLLEQRDDIKTFASYNTPEQSIVSNTPAADNHIVSEYFHAGNLKQCVREKKYDELPALVLLIPNYM